MGLMKRKGGTEGRMWQRCGVVVVVVGVCVCGLQIQRESLERLTRKTCGTAQTGELFLVTPFAIVSYLANNKIIDANLRITD